MRDGPSPIFVFDAFGTLFDVHSAMREHAAALGPNAQRFSDIWRAKQLEYTWIYAGIGNAAGQAAPDFRTLTEQSLTYALATTGLPQSLAPQLLESYWHLKAFPEVADSLADLKRRDARLAILSNADADMLDQLVTTAGVSNMFAHLLSVRCTGTYKPAPVVYGLATEAFKCAPRDIVFVSSNRWDCAGAKAFGFKTVWVNRTSAPEEYSNLTPDRVVPDIANIIR